MSKTYTREGFARKLKRLPLNKSFCKKGLCPIATFYAKKGADEPNMDARALDLDFTTAIDRISSPRVEGWADITPAKALAVLETIAVMEAKPKFSPGVL